MTKYRSFSPSKQDADFATVLHHESINNLNSSMYCTTFSCPNKRILTVVLLRLSSNGHRQLVLTNTFGGYNFPYLV